ncbi:unnamed protein product [Caenorhabditis angaria]|uniref:SXP/RAL-2 family protein Ani s 5-like cation-binding domain-containing protein n=1 Tax=Caenorhabditis angaria TaxID=860376 RepID=A0A9P1N4R1_9PELO|nr:unnamed protein product [Caenorhabditis angaria]
MSKFLIAASIIAVVCAAPTMPTAEEAKAELIAAGVSSDAAAGIVAIAEKYKDQFEAAKSDREAGKTAFDAFQTEVKAYLKEQSESDRDAYEKFVEKKKADHQAHHTTPSTA